MSILLNFDKNHELFRQKCYLCIRYLDKMNIYIDYTHNIDNLLFCDFWSEASNFCRKI